MENGRLDRGALKFLDGARNKSGDQQTPLEEKVGNKVDEGTEDLEAVERAAAEKAFSVLAADKAAAEKAEAKMVSTEKLRMVEHELRSDFQDVWVIEGEEEGQQVELALIGEEIERKNQHQRSNKMAIDIIDLDVDGGKEEEEEKEQEEDQGEEKEKEQGEEKGEEQEEYIVADAGDEDDMVDVEEVNSAGESHDEDEEENMEDNLRLGDNSWERHLTQKAVAGQLRFKDLMLEMNEGEDGKEEEKRQGSNDEDWNPIGKSHQRVEKGSSQAICGCGDEEKEVIREVKPQTVFFTPYRTVQHGVSEDL